VLRYRITLTEKDRNVVGLEQLRAQEIAVLMYGRWNVMLDKPDWGVVKTCVYAGSDEVGDTVKPLGRGDYLLAKQGWYASLKPCAAGPMLTVDLACCAFLASGGMVELMAKIAGFRNPQELHNACQQGPLSPRQLSEIDKAVAKLKVKVTHLGFWKVARHLGPPANHPASSFEHEGRSYTVQDYYALKARSDPRYPKALKYPYLPTINMGSKTKPELYPAELVAVPAGQPRNRLLSESPFLVADMIKYAAVKPAERMRHITEHSGSVVNVLRTDATAIAFGLNTVSATPATVTATVLPPAELQYGRGQVVHPRLKGSWNAEAHRFLQSPPSPVVSAKGAGFYSYAILLVGPGPPACKGWEELVAEFRKALETVAASAGTPLNVVDPDDSSVTCRVDPQLLEKKMGALKKKGVRIVLVVMVDERAYGTIKLVSDEMALPTQCIKWSKLLKAPKGIHYNVLLKMNFKLGGTAHTLRSRLPAGAAAAPATFQLPPASLSWVFDKPCMLVGIDVSHPEPGMIRDSMAAVVGSMDGSATKYVAHISSQAGRQEMVGALVEAMGCLFTAFRARNSNRMPETVIVYRDGVSEGQYDQVLQHELPQIHTAIELQGFAADAVRVVIVVCTKGHRTRLVCSDNAGSGYVNPCPGLVVDSHITSDSLNEFYLNSHAAIQGTAKPCRYTLLYDELGFKMSELQLLTYWTTYLYARCNKSVSYATPAYYAHWASKRGKELLAAGATVEQLRNISDVCSRVDNRNNMFFL
jgi:eukaryotic translation initiation factor 2C